MPLRPSSTSTGAACANAIVGSGADLVLDFAPSHEGRRPRHRPSACRNGSLARYPAALAAAAVLLLFWINFASDAPCSSFGITTAAATSTASILEELYCGASNCYELLGLNPTESSTILKKDVTRQYRRLSLKYHPDRNSSPDSVAQFQKVAKAYEVLSNSKNRDAYDYYLKNPDSLWALYFGFRAQYAARTSPLLVAVLVAVFVSIAQYVNFKWQRNYAISSVRSTPKFKKALDQYIEKEHRGQFKRWTPEEKKAATEKAVLELLDVVEFNGKVLGSVAPAFNLHDLLVARCLCAPFYWISRLVTALSRRIRKQEPIQANQPLNLQRETSRSDQRGEGREELQLRRRGVGKEVDSPSRSAWTASASPMNKLKRSIPSQAPRDSVKTTPGESVFT